MKYFVACLSTFCLMAGMVLCDDLSSLSFYTEPALFPFTSVVSVAEDSNNCLYFATSSGLIKYNGITYEKYEHFPFDDTTIRSSQIQTMYMDKDDVLWLGTAGGLERFDLKTGKINHFSVSDDTITAIFCDSVQRLWIGTSNGLYLCRDINSKNFIRFHTDKGDSFIGNAIIGSISEDSHGIIYASTHEGVWQYNETKKEFESCTLIPEGCPGKTETVYHFIEDSDGTYWLSVWGVGIVRIIPGKKTFDVYSLPNSRVYTLCDNVINKDYIAAGTLGGGIYVINKKTNKIFPYEPHQNQQGSLTSGVIYSLFVNAYNILFVGTADALNIADLSKPAGDSASLLYDTSAIDGKKQSHLDNTISCLAAEGQYLWAASHNTLIRYHLDKAEVEEFPFTVGDSSSDDTLIYAVSVISDREVWAATDKGLYLFNTATAVFTPAPLLNRFLQKNSHFLIRTLYQDGDKTLWMGTYGAGLIHYDPQKGILAHYRHSTDKNSLSNDIISFINRDSNGILWIGTNKGLCRYEADTETFTPYFYHVDRPAGISSNHVNSFYEDKQGNLWFATNDGGICRFNPQREVFRTYTKDHGLSSNQVLGITDADDGFLWIAGLKDLHIFDIVHETAQAYAITTMFNYNCFSCPPLVLKERGVIFLGTDKGLLKISQEKLYNARLQYIPIKIQALAVDGKQILLGEKKQHHIFSYETNDIKISFAAPYASRRKKNVCAYKLVGFDKDWTVASGKNFVRYTNLAPGSYTFLVKNAAEGPYAAVHDSISFTIKRNFFTSPIMFVFYGAIIAGIVFLLYKTHKLYWLEHYANVLEEKQLALIQDNATLQGLSMLDYLTGIGNRRYIDTIGLRIWRMAKDNGVSIAVMMLDIDFFKAYNDHFGHQAGDKLLHCIGTDLKKRIRTETDLIGRYGGEEFLIVLYNLCCNKAQPLAEEIRKTVETMYRRHPEQVVGKATISIGVFSDIPSGENTFEQMIRKADCALYCAKRTGRNKVVCYGPAMETIYLCQ